MAYCGDCFHLDVCKTADSCDGRVPRCRHFADKTAISQALGKQERKKPFRISLADRKCPVCGAYIPYDALNDGIEEAPLFCDNCGQALEWREENAQE